MTRLRFLNRWVLFAVVAGAIAALHGPGLLLHPPQLHRHPHPVGGGAQPAFGLRRPDLFRARRLLRPGGLHLRHPHRHLRRRSLAGPGGRAGGLRHRRLPDRHPGPEAPGLLPGHGHPRVRHHRLHHLERSPRASPADLRGSAASRRCPWPASPSTPPGASIC